MRPNGNRFFVPRSLSVLGFLTVLGCTPPTTPPPDKPPATTPPLFTSYTVAGGAYAIALDASGHKWIGTWGNGLVFFDDNGTPTNKTDDTWVTFTTTEGLANHIIRDIVIDASGALWIATWGGGVSRFDNNGTPANKADDTWTGFATSDGLVHGAVRVIAIDPSGRKWFGTTGGLSCLDDKGTPTNKSDDTWTSFGPAVGGMQNQDVMDLVFPTAGSAWIGNGAGLNYLDFNATPGNKTDDIWASFTSTEGLPVAVVLSVRIDSSGRKWICSGNEISCLDDNGTPTNKSDDVWTTFTPGDELPYGSVYSLAIDGAGRKWIVAHSTVSEGLVCVLDDTGSPTDKSDDIYTTYSSSDGLDGELTLDLVIDGSNAKWVGTAAGLAYCP